MAEFHITIEGMWSNSGKGKKFDARPEHIVPGKVKDKPKKNKSKKGEEDEDNETAADSEDEQDIDES